MGAQYSHGVPRVTPLLARITAGLAICGLLAGCFGYNRSAKGWAYVGDSLLMVGGAAAITADVTTRPGPCEGPGCPTYTPPFGGALVAGAVLAAAGLVGVVINATRTSVKTSR